MKTLGALLLAEIGLGLLPFILPGLVLILLIAYLLIKPLYWLGAGFAVYKLGSLLIARRDRLTRERLDKIDPPLVDKSHGRNTDAWTEWFGIG